MPTQSIPAERREIRILHHSLILCLTAFGLVHSGCMGIRTNHAAVRSVTIARDISKPAKMALLTTTNQSGVAVGGVVGLAIASANTGRDAETRNAFERGLAERHADIATMLRDAVARELRKGGRFELRESPPTDGKVQLTIDSWGLVYTANFGEFSSRRYIPTLTAKAELSRTDGTVLRRSRDTIRPRDPRVGGAELTEYLAKPDLLHTRLQQAVDAVAHKLVADLQQ